VGTNGRQNYVHISCYPEHCPGDRDTTALCWKFKTLLSATLIWIHVYRGLGLKLLVHNKLNIICKLAHIKAQVA
jgi:hypothetical protein